MSENRKCKIAMKILIVLCIFCLGFIISELSYTARHQINDVHLNYQECDQIDDFHQFVYLYDTKQKLEDYYKTMKEVFGSESIKARSLMNSRTYERPLVKIGPIVVCASTNTNGLYVRATSNRSVLMSLESSTLEGGEPSNKLLVLSSFPEKDLGVPRLNAYFSYSADDIYLGGNFGVYSEGGENYSYFDFDGSGRFDIMQKIDYENGVLLTYRLNGLTWEPLDKVPSELQPYPRGPGTMPPGLGSLPHGILPHETE